MSRTPNRASARPAGHTAPAMTVAAFLAASMAGTVGMGVAHADPLPVDTAAPADTAPMTPVADVPNTPPVSDPVIAPAAVDNPAPATAPASEPTALPPAPSPPAPVAEQAPAPKAKVVTAAAVTPRSPAAAVVALAREQLANPKAGTFYSQGAYEAWCANFVSWVLKETGTPLRNPDSGGWRIAGVYRMMDTFKANGTFQARGYKPKPGDVVLYGGSGHTNLVVSVNDDGTMTTIGGNESNRVASRTLSVRDASIVGFGVTPGGDPNAHLGDESVAPAPGPDGDPVPVIAPAANDTAPAETAPAPVEGLPDEAPDAVIPDAAVPPAADAPIPGAVGAPGQEVPAPSPVLDPAAAQAPFDPFAPPPEAPAPQIVPAVFDAGAPEALPPAPEAVPAPAEPVVFFPPAPEQVPPVLNPIPVPDATLVGQEVPAQPVPEQALTPLAENTAAPVDAPADGPQHLTGALPGPA